MTTTQEEIDATLDDMRAAIESNLPELWRLTVNNLIERGYDRRYAINSLCTAAVAMCIAEHGGLKTAALLREVAGNIEAEAQQYAPTIN